MSLGKLDINIEITDGSSQCEKLNGPLAVSIYSGCSGISRRLLYTNHIMAIDTGTELQPPSAYCRQLHLSHLFSFFLAFLLPYVYFCWTPPRDRKKEAPDPKAVAPKNILPATFAIFAGAKSDQNFHHSRH